LLSFECSNLKEWHPHLHILVADGLFFENDSFYVMPRNDLRPLQELFRASVLKMLKKEGKIGDDLIRKIMRWRHTSGFAVHNGVQLAQDDAEGAEALAQYIIRNPFSLKKLCYKVWEVDPLICQHFRAEMKVVSFINEVAVIRRILDHLGLWTEIKPVSRPPPKPMVVCECLDYEPIDDGWAGYEEPCIQLT
jgi:hypothetical protein